MLEILNINFTDLLINYKYWAIFTLLTTNGFCNLPSSQITYLGVGYFVSTGKLDFWMSVMAGTAGNVLGNFILSFMITKYGINFAKKFTYINDKALGSFAQSVNKNGYLYLIVAKLIPNLKVLVPVIVGVSGLPAKKAILVYALGSGLWAIIVIKIGEYFGGNISWQYYSIAVFALALVTVTLFYLRFIKPNIVK